VLYLQCMSTNITASTRFKYITIVAIALLFLSFLFVYHHGGVSAGKEEVLRAKTTRLEEEIAENEAKIAELNSQASTLKNKIAQLQVEITTAANKIKLTKLKINELEKEIEATEQELARQKKLLKHTLVTLYKEGNITTIELLASSDSYTDFINQQEYLSRMKDRVHDSVEKVDALKAKLETEKEKQDALLLEQQTQRDIIAEKKNEQQRTLERTEGEEARYQAIQEDLIAQKTAAENELSSYLASLVNHSVSLGPVSAGEVVGAIGNTGYSTGPHVHFTLYTADTLKFGVDPISTINQQGWEWPVSGGGVLTQSWGCSGMGIYPWNPAYGCGFHNGIDVAAPEGTPLVALADGDIIHKGCMWTGTIFSTFVVVIDYGNGYYSLYAHMVAPPGSAYDACRANTYW